LIINQRPIPSRLTPEQFAQALQSLDLASIPERQRFAALTAHAVRIASETATLPADRASLRATLLSPILRA
jgi:hypothetical protein